MSDYYERSLKMHQEVRGKIQSVSKVPVKTLDDLSLAYTPGVARPCEVIAKDPSKARELTIKGNSVAVVTDGSAVLGLGNIGPLAALPVMEGKCVLFKEYADIDAWPICLDTQDTDAIVETVKRIAPAFGGINLEDIAAPRCFEVEARLQEIGIPVFHDDQHGTAIVLLAALLNASKVTGKPLSEMRVVINGAGAAGAAIAKLLGGIGFDKGKLTPVKDIVLCDTQGAISKSRPGLSGYKAELAGWTNLEGKTGTVQEVLVGADVFVGVSKGNLLTREDIGRMKKDAILFAMANPVPEIMPDEALKAGAAVVGTGRSDLPNQVNNVLAYPGIFRGALNARATRISPTMMVAAALALASSVPNPTASKVVPSPLERQVAPLVAEAVEQAWRAG